MSAHERERLRVLIAGGGVAAVETLLALRALAGPRVEVTLLSPEQGFLYRPVTVAEAFERGEARTYSLADIVADQGHGALVWDSLTEVDAENGVGITASGKQLPFDALVIATGARAREAFPGALTFRGRPDVPALRAMLDDLATGRAHSIALALPSERIWPLPIYELALMTAAHLQRTRRPPGPGHARDPRGGAARDVRAHGVARHLAAARRARHHRADLVASGPLETAGRCMLVGGGSIPADRVLTLPVLEGPAIAGLPSDGHGFIPVDAHGRVAGAAGVYAVGDVTSFPLKQGGLAAQQADAVAEVIAAEAGADVTPAPFSPVLRGLLMTGGAPLYLRSEPQRLPRTASVAIEATHRGGHGASSAAGQALWWPPAKIAGRYLAPYLATARPQPLAAEPLVDRVAVPGHQISDAEFDDALELALMLADCDARWGDYRSALSALDAAEALQGSLPPEYETKRRQWRLEISGGTRPG